MRGGDSITAAYVDRLLTAHGISASTGGSIGWSTSVPKSQAEHARGLLRREAGLQGRIDWVETSDGCASGASPKDTSEELRVGRSYSDALRAFSMESEAGRVLRDSTLRSLADREPGLKVERIRWSNRPFITSRLEPTSAIEATVVLSGASRPIGEFERSIEIFE